MPAVLADHTGAMTTPRGSSATRPWLILIGFAAFMALPALLAFAGR